ncbi:stage V sporulation protein AD [Caldanaerobius fijiensis DSM 17918]|uniref:Stage V sporulation protein AD n=1 Tax=Caldanaerobius fijiensis DSM 17918 TaxID=1121256 RepID=A0A1M4UB57_9THEO|nr:stage V sporulation protein AD [Caldanaerobius fijiensis]SHE54022.1 stage V sporulation protein AD [Caldanaerobius fijiensis DSM 17918]
MAVKKIGKQTVKLQNPPSIIAYASVVGPKEGDGPLKEYFDQIEQDDYLGEKCWEKAECKMLQNAIILAMQKAKITTADVDYLLAGDLLNQIISSSFTARQLQIPYIGLYGACSTMSESLSLGALLIDGGFADYVIAATSSHFSSAERQYRFPLELGTQRPLTAQWTVTGAGATVLSSSGDGPYITYITTGRVLDLGIKDANNMGAAMAPAAVDTIKTHFSDTGFGPDDYDLIITGDLAKIGKDLTLELLKKDGIDISNIYTDCGIEIYDCERQDTHAGGSGCGCSAVVLNGYILTEIKKGTFKRVLFMATGALLSTTSSQQGESIPGIAHAVTIEMR